MSNSFRDHLAREKRFSWIPLALLFCGLILLIGHSLYFSGPQLYVGYLRLEAASANTQPYVSFNMPDDKSQRHYMVLAKDPVFYAGVEALVDKKVLVKAILHRNQPSDFDKIDIIEINELSE